MSAAAKSKGLIELSQQQIDLYTGIFEKAFRAARREFSEVRTIGMDFGTAAGEGRQMWFAFTDIRPEKSENRIIVEVEDLAVANAVWMRGILPKANLG